MGRKPLDEKQSPPAAGASYPKMAPDADTEVRMAPAFARILESVFKVDVWADYSKLEDALKVGQRGLTDRATLMQARDDAEDNARLAHKLYCAARVEQERYELQAKLVEGVARRRAVRDLCAEKASGQRTKQITEADIEGHMLMEYPDEYEHLQLSRLKLRKMVEHIERLAELWVSRGRALDTMLGKSR